MKLKELNNKKIAVLGFGLENIALLKYLLSQKIEADFVICDARSKKQLGDRFDNFKKYKNISWKLGESYDKTLDEHDVIFRAAGYPLHTSQIKKAKRKKVKITSAINLFLEWTPTNNIVGVTGTNGKGTTTNILHSIFKKAKKNVYWGGNIGNPVFSFFRKLKKTDWVILELSSFQLEDMEISPHIAVLTNFTPDHLKVVTDQNPNYHKDMAEYRKAKTNIFAFQKKDDYAIFNEKMSTRYWKFGKAKKIFFAKSDLESNLPGEYNKENIGAALEVAKIAKIPNKFIVETVKKIKPLPYRMEFVKEIKGVKYYNDSVASSPEPSIKALKSFKKGVILLAGGADKGADFTSFSKEIEKRVKFLVLFKGEGSSKIKNKLGISKDKFKVVTSMNDAISIAKKKAEEGDVVLLSTACASFGVFKNYKDRGEQFTSAVKKLK